MYLCGRFINTISTSQLSSTLTVWSGTSYLLPMCKQMCTLCNGNNFVTVTSLHRHFEGLIWSPSKSNRLYVLKSSLTLLQTRATSSNNNTGRNVHKILPNDVEGFKKIYTGPLKGAVRAIKVFSLCTCVAAVVSAPIFIWLGKASVPLMGRILMTSLVTTFGVGTTGLLHWLLKGYVLQLHYNAQTQIVRVQTLSVIGRKKMTEFHISESGPPPKVSGFSSFQAKGKSYFLHTDVFKDKNLLSGLLGSFMGLEHGERVDREK